MLEMERQMSLMFQRISSTLLGLDRIQAHNDMLNVEGCRVLGRLLLAYIN